MNILESAARTLAQACDGNPVLTTVTIILFYLMFAILEAGVEKLIWGDRFEHWLNPIFVGAFIAYSAYSVYWCALWNVSKAA